MSSNLTSGSIWNKGYRGFLTDENGVWPRLLAKFISGSALFPTPLVVLRSRRYSSWAISQTLNNDAFPALVDHHIIVHVMVFLDIHF